MIAELDRARDALHAIDPGCDRETWVRVAMGAKAAGLSLETFDAWSSTAGNYGGSQDVASVWRSINGSGGIGPATLFGLARDAGWRDDANGHARTHQKPQEPPKPRPKVQSPAFDCKAAWDAMEPATAAHGYIAAKLGLPDGLRVVPTDSRLTTNRQSVAGWLAVPLRDGDELASMQFISPTGDKLTAPGPMRGWHTVGGPVQPGSITYVCEGIGAAWSCHQATQRPAVVAFGLGRMQKVAAAVAGMGAEVVLVGDVGTEDRIEKIAAEVGCRWVVPPAELGRNADANDLHQRDGMEAVADLLAGAIAAEDHRRFKMLTAADILSLPVAEDLIRGVLPRSGLAAMFSPSGSGKSFLILDMVGALQTGEPWFGRRTRPVKCTYVVLEGQGGLRKRVEAYQAVNGPLDGVAFMVEPFAIIEPDQADELADRIIESGNAGGLVVIDTLSRAAGGVDENGPEGMGRILAGAGRLQHRLGGLVLLVHHTGKDTAKGLRGHSSLVGALDAAIEVNRDGDNREWIIAKNKDDRDGEGHLFTLRVVELGTDADGEPITSCVVHPMLGTAEAKKKPTLPTGGNQRIAYQALGGALRNAGEARPEGAPEALPPGRPTLTLEAAIDAVGDRLAVDSKRRRERAMLALTGLVNRGLIVIQGGYLWAA